MLSLPQSQDPPADNSFPPRMSWMLVSPKLQARSVSSSKPLGWVRVGKRAALPGDGHCVKLVTNCFPSCAWRNCKTYET